MADDISKKYAVNIDLNVNSSNLDKLNDAENILDKAFLESQKTSQQERNQSSHQINVDTSSIESKIEKIISIISSQDRESKRPLDEAVIRAISDSFKSSLLEIFKHVNSVFSTRVNQQSDLEKPVEVISPQKKTPKNSKNKTSTPSTSSDMTATGEIQLASGNTANTSLVRKKMMVKTESTTGVSANVIKDSNAVSNDAIATTIHSQKPSIHIARGVDRISEYSSMPHEYLHVLQQSKMFNTNSFLSNVFGGGGSFDKGVIKKANEFVTNVISSIYAALDKNLSDTDFNAIKNTYISSIIKASGINEDIAGAAISSVDMIRGLNISPEAMGGIIGRDISGLSLKNGTELERAIASSGKKNISVKNGQIFIGRGKNKKELTSIDGIYNLGLKNSDGHAIDRSVIASHFISRGVINGLGNIEVSRSGSGKEEKINTISSFGFGKTRKQAGSEFSEQSSFGIPFLPQEELRRRFETRNAVVSTEQLKSILSSAVRDTYNGRVIDRESGKEFDVKRTSAKRHNNFRFGLNKFQSLVYALGGDDTLRIAEENGLGNVKNNAEALNIIRIAHLFKGDASAEVRHVSGLNKYQKNNYDELVRLFEGSASSYLSQEEFSPVTYKGFRNNIDNQDLANTIYTAGGLQRGVKTGRIPSYYVSDKSEYVKPGVSKAFNTGNVSLNKESENGEGDIHQFMDTIGVLDEGLQAEAFDTKEIIELKEKFLTTRDKLETLREQVKNRRKITSGINKEDIALIGNGQDFGIIELESNEKISAKDRKSAISKIDDMLIALAKRAEQELEAAKERLGEDYSDYNVNITQNAYDVFSGIIEKYKRENNKSFLSERDASIVVNDALQQILGYNDEQINAHIVSGMDIDILGTKMSPKSFKKFREDVSKSFSNYLNKHGGVFSSDMVGDFGAGAKEKVSDKLSAIDSQIVELQNSMRNLGSEAQEVVEKKIEELYEIRQTILLAKAEIDLYAKRLAGTMFARITKGGINDNLLAYISAFGRPSGPYELATGRNAQLSMATGGVFDADRFAEIRKNGHDRIIENGDIKKKYAPFGALPRNYIETMSLTEEPTMRIIEEAKRLSNANIGRLGLFKGGNQITENINDFLSDRLLDGVSASPSKYDSGFGGFVSNFIDSMNKDTVIDNGTSMTLKAGKTLFHGTDDDKYKNPLEMGDRFDTGIHFGQDIVPALSRLLTNGLGKYGVRNVLDKFNKDYTVNGMTINKGESFLDRFDVLSELMKESGKNRRLIQATLKEDIKALKVDGNGVSSFEGINFYNNNGELYSYDEAIHTDENKKGFMEDYDLYGKRLFEALERDLGRTKSEELYKNYAAELTDSKNVRDMLIKAGYGAVAYSNDMEDNGRQSIMMLKDTLFRTSNKDIFGTRGGTDTISPLLTSLENLSETIKLFNSRMEVISVTSNGSNTVIGRSDMASGNSDDNNASAEELLNTVFNEQYDSGKETKKKSKKSSKKEATDVADIGQNEPVEMRQNELDQKLAEEISKLSNNILQKLSFNNSSDGVLDGIRAGVETIKDILSKQKNSKTLSLSKKTITDIVSAIPKQSKEKSTINIKSIDDIKNIVSVIKEIVSKHQNVKTFSLSKKSLQEISLIISSRSNKKSGREDKFNNELLSSIGKDISLIKDIINKKKTDTPSFKKIANEISSEIKHAIGRRKDGSNNNDKYRTIIEQLRFIRQNTRAISTKLDSVNNGVKSSKIKSFDKDIKNLISSLKGSSSNLGKSILSAIEKGFSGVVINTQISDKPIVAPKVDSVSQFLAEAERQRRLSVADNIKIQESGKNKENNNTGSYQSDKKRLDREKFELELASKETKKDKLSFIDEEISKITDRIKSSPDDGRLKLEAELASLKRRRIRIENSAGTKEDKLEFNEWRDSLRSQQKEFISNLRGKGSEDISRAVSEEVKRLLNLEENRSVGNYDKKSEIQKLTTKLKEFEQSSRIKNDKNSLSDAINELKRKYKGEDNAFDATLKGAGVDDRPEKLRKEVERLNSVLDELKAKKEEALGSGDEASAKFYDTLIFQRQIRKDVVQGKQNAADKALRIADENAAARAIKEAERAQKQEQKRLDAMAAAHDKEGNQARSVFNKAVEYGAMSTLVYGFASEAKNAIDVMSKFERQMVEVTKVMDPLYQSQELLTESAKRMAVQYGVSIIESAKGMAVFAQQGKNAAQIIQLTEASLLAANTTTLNAAQATEALTATIRQFNLTDSDAKRIIDSWLEVESRTAISAQTMADAIKISGTAARVAGLSFDEFNGILSAVGSATRETGSQLGTAFKFIISKMRTDDAVTALNRLGVATHNQNGDYRDLMVVLSDLNAKWVEMSQEQKASTAIAIAGTRRYNTLMTLMEKWDDALEAVSMSEDSHGKAMRMNAAVMDTYEKKVQKARASVEAFYASMSKGTTKGFLGGIQESISMFASIGEKTQLASGLAQAGIVASGISFFSRMGGSMGLGTALGDLKANSEIKSEISKAIASEIKSSIGSGKALFRSHSSREAALERLKMIDSGKNVSSEINKDSKFLDGRDALAEKIATRIAGVNQQSEIYQSTLKRVQNEISRTIASHKDYIEKLESHKSGVERFGIAAGEFAKKHATVIAAIGIGLQTLANSEFFKDEKSLTGKTTAGEVIDLAGSVGTAIGAGAAAAQFGGPWAGVAVGALSMLGPLVSNLQSLGEKITGSTRLTLLRLQEESDRLKTLTTSIDSYSRLREKERSGQALTLEEQEQKRILEQNISLASPTAIKIGHRGIGSSLDEGEFEKLVGRKTEFKDKYASISDQMAYEQMFSQTFGGKTISDDLRNNLFTEQKALDVQLSKLRDFDAEHTGELSESEHSDRMKIIEEIKKIQERISKGNTAINEVEQAFFAAVRNRESGVLNATRRGESYEANDGPNDRIRKMFEQIVANRNGNISEARKVTSEAILSGIISRGTIKNRTTAIEHAQRTGMLYSATRGRELEGGKQEIILHTRAADGSIRKSESIIMDKKGSDDDYIREVATRKGLDARSIAYTSELSDTLFRYSLKEVEKFSELTRKIGDTIYNSYKAEVDRINSIEGISSKFRIGGVDSQYRGSDIRLEEALRATSMRAKSAGSVDSELIKKMAEYAKNSNPSKAMFAGAEISSQIARHNTLAGATEHLVMSMSTQVQKANMANQIIEAIYRASFKTERGRDGEVADIGGEEKKRINEYLAMAGLGFDEFDKIRHSLGSEATEEDFKRALMSRVSAAADIMAKRDADDISKYFKMLEDNVERLANIMKQTAEAMEIKRKDSFATNLDYSGMVFDRDIVNSYKGMAAHASMYDDEITKLSAVVEASRSGVDIQKNSVDKALKTRDEAIVKYGRDSQQAITANDNYLRLKNNYDQALSSLNISLEKLDNLKGLQQQLKAMATGSFGEHKAFMRTVESSAIGESTRNGNISFGIGSSDYNNISLLAEQNRVLSDRRMDIQLQYDAYAQMAKDGKLTEEQKTEMKSLELQLGEIDKAIRENGMKLDTANMNLEKTYAEARRNTRRLQLEHLANALSGSKDTGRSQKAMFDDNYNRMRGLWRDYVSAMQQNPNAVSEDQKQYMKELAKKMENLRDVGDLMGNPAFNKNYLLASAQDQAIADNIMQRLQSGETMRQIFSDAGMKEMGRNNPLISQLMDNMMQKQENQRLADVSNQMLDVETEMLGYLKNIAGLMNNPMFRVKIEEGGKSNSEAQKGLASGTTFTGSGGKFESAGLVEIHKGEGLGVLSQTAMARYPMMSRKVLQMISDMNLGTYPGFSNGTRDNIGRFIYDVDYSVGNNINGRVSYASDNAIRQIVDAIKNGTAKPIHEKDVNSENASSVVDFGGNKFIIPPQLFKSIISIEKNTAAVSYSMSASGIGKDISNIRSIVSKDIISEASIIREAERIIKNAPLSNGKREFHKNLSGNAETTTRRGYDGLVFRYGKDYDQMTPVQKAMVRFHEEAGHGSMFRRTQKGIVQDAKAYGLASPEFFADAGAIAMGRRPFIYSAYQTDGVGGSNRLVASLPLSSKKTAVDAYLSLQEGYIKNPEIVRRQLAHIQTADASGDEFIRRKDFYEAGVRSIIPFIKDARGRGDYRSARQLIRNHRQLTDSVFANGKNHINYWEYKDDIISGRIGLYRDADGTISSHSAKPNRKREASNAVGPVSKRTDAYVMRQAVEDLRNSKVQQERAVVYDRAVRDMYSRVGTTRVGGGKPTYYNVEGMRIPYSETKMSAEQFRQFYYDNQMNNGNGGKFDWKDIAPGTNKTFKKDLKSKLLEYSSGTSTIEYSVGRKRLTLDDEVFSSRKQLDEHIKKNANKISSEQKINPSITRAEEFRVKYDALRNLRKANRANGLTVRNEVIRSAYNPIEMAMQSRAADFVRAGGLGIIRDRAVEFARPAASWTADIGVRAYNRGLKPTVSLVADLGAKGYDKGVKLANRFNENIRESRFNSARSGSGLRSWFRDNFTEAGLESRSNILKNRVLESKRARTRAVIGINDANNRYIEASHGVSSENIDNILSDSKKYTTAKVNAEKRFQRDVSNAREYLPSINRRLATVRGINRVTGFVNDRAIKPVTSGINKFTSRGAMKLKMLESAYQGGMETFNNVKEGEYWKASESGLRTVGSLHYAGALEKIPGGGKLSKIAPAAYYLSGGLELARGIKDGNAETIVSGAGNIANAALFSRPVQNLLENAPRKALFKQPSGRLGRNLSTGKMMGLGMAADLIGTGIEKLGDHYNKPWLKRTGQVVGGIGESASDIALTSSTMGFNKVVSGAIDAGRFLFDDKYREDYGDRRAHVGGGFIALEQISKLVPGASGAYRALGFDVPGMLDDINSNYANVNASRERNESLHRNRSNVMGALLRNDNLKYGANANRENKKAATEVAFATINEASKETLAKGPDASQAAMEAYFRNEDASQMMSRYDVSGKKNTSVRAQGEILKLHARLAKLDEEDQSWSSNLFGVSWGGNARQKERNEINKRIAELEKEGSFDRGKQVENTRQAAQEHFDNLFGRKANVFGKGGILEGIRRKRRDAEVKKEEDALSKNQDALAEARNALFNDDKLTYSYASLADMEHAAKIGDEKAQAELAKFNERASKDKRVTDASGRIAVNKKRIADLNGKKIDGDGEITEQDFDDLRQFERSSIEIKTNNKNKEIDRLKSQEKKLEEDIALMEKEGSSAEAIKKKKEELQGVQAQIGKATGERDKLSIDKRISDRLASGKLADPKKLAAEAAEMEEKRKASRAIYDDPNKIRELNAGKTVTVKIGGKEVTLNKEQVQAWKGISDEAIAKKRKEQQTAQETLSEAVSEETIRQDLAKKYGGDVSKVTPEMVEARKKEIKENQRKEAEKRENERQDRVYSGTVFGKREAAQKAFDDSVARRDRNKAKIVDLEDKMSSGEITEKEKEELREAKNMQLYYDRAVDRNQGELNRTNRAVVARQRAAREGRGGDARLVGLSKEDYEKERASNEKRIKELEEKKSEEGLTDSEGKELSRRKNMTRTMFVESDLRRFKKDKNRLAELRQKKADGKTLTEDEQKEFDSLGKQDFSDEAEKKLVSNIDADYENKNGGMSFKQLEEEERKERRKITLDNLGLKSIKYNKETGRYEAEDDKRANTPSVDERTESLGGEDTKQTADVFGSGPRTAGVSGTLQTTVGDDKNIGAISKDTAMMTATLEQVLEKMGEILKLIPQTSGSASEKNTPPKEGDKVPV